MRAQTGKSIGNAALRAALRAALGAALAALVAGAVWLALHPGDLDRLRGAVAAVDALRQAHPAAVFAALWALYVTAAALSLPLSVWLTLAAGALFGLAGGLALVLTAAPLGSTAAFLAARRLGREALRARLGPRAAGLEARVARDGAFALFALRLVPVVPFWLVNLAMGLTGMRVSTFAWVSALGMAPGTAVYVNAGRQLPTLTSLSGLLSLPMLASLAALAVLPFAARGLVRRLGARRALKGWGRPRHYERNLVVIGGGAAGLVAANVAAGAGARVTLIEAGAMGGECLNSGCVPSKALIRAARAAQSVREAGRFGIRAGAPEVDFPAVFATVRDRVAAIAPHDSAERYRGLGVEVIAGRARLADPWTVEVTEAGGALRRITTRAIVLATGAEPVMPEVPGLAAAGALTSDTLWDAMAARAQAPARMVVLGGGAVGVELSQAFARLGVAVTLIEAAARLLPGGDADLSAAAEAALAGDGVEVRLAARVTGAGPGWVELAGGERLACDESLVAAGRRPRVEGLGLEALGLLEDGRLVLDPCLATRIGHIFAAGDLAGPVRLTHAAGHQGTVAALNALFGFVWRLRADRALLPRVTFSDPELAEVGLSEAEAARQGVAVEVVRVDLAGNDRAIVEGAVVEGAGGFVKIVVGARGRVLGAAIAAPHAGEMVAELALAIRKGMKMGALLSTIHAYPTYADAHRTAAARWRAGRIGPATRALLDKLNRFRRKEPR